GHTGSDAVSIDSITQDTGSNTSDFKTSDQTLSVSGKAYLETGDTLTVSFNGTTYTLGGTGTNDGKLTIDGNGVWTLDATGTSLTDGTYTATATVTDVAGNTANASQDIVVDT
ncbi:Ig-like domain-containing protein, partial [Hydrogenovibrio sp. JE_KL2]|uniref:Ig-like domain-containing protein n=1 Tax=Hydrogenovibrio sp. JE_KL2 TaxID=2651188 RepID=UPI001C12CC27